MTSQEREDIINTFEKVEAQARRLQDLLSQANQDARSMDVQEALGYLRSAVAEL